MFSQNYFLQDHMNEIQMKWEDVIDIRCVIGDAVCMYAL